MNNNTGPSPTRDAIFEAIRLDGPQTTLQLADELGLSRDKISGSLKHAKQKGLVHIAAWYRRQGPGTTWIPMYGLGNKPDKEMPAEGKLATNARYRDKFRARTRAMQRKTVNPFLDLLR